MPERPTRLLPLVLICTVACGARSSSSYVFRTAPNPNGCYAQVFAQEQFRGEGDYVNGPARYADISQLHANHRWQGAVRSLRTGPATTVTVWSEENYRGSLARVGPDQRNARIRDTLNGSAASFQIACN